MSVVCASVEHDGIRIAADSGIYCGDSIKTGIEAAKLVQIGNNYAIGGTGDFGEILALHRYAASHRRPKNTEQSVFNFMRTFYTKWYEDKQAFYPNKTATTDSDPEEEVNEYLIVLDGKAFSCAGHRVVEVSGFEAIGAGAPFARTSLYYGYGAKEAVEISSKLCAYVHLPVISFYFPFNK